MPPVRRPSSPLFSFGTWDDHLASDFPLPGQATFQDALLESREIAYPTPFSNALSSCPVRSTVRVPPPRRLTPVSPSVSMIGSWPSNVPFPLSAMRSPFATKPKRDVAPGTHVGRWTKREHELFLEGLQRFGKSWKKISSLVHTRTLVQIRTHAQKYLQKQSRGAVKQNAQHSGISRDLLTFLTETSPLYGAPPLQDNTCVPAFVDEYYTSPTAIEDDLLGLVHPSELWVPQLTQDISASNSLSFISAAGSVLRPTSSPVPARDALASGQRPSTPGQVAAHKFDETNVWL